MKKLLIMVLSVSMLLTLGSMAWAASNLNSSRSNIYRAVYDGMTPAQGAAFLAECDKNRPMDETTVRKILQKLFITANFKLIIIQPAVGTGKPSTIILLTNPGQLGEAQAIAVSDEGAGGRKAQ